MENGMEAVNDVHYCIHCKSNSITNPQYIFFRFPKEPKRCAIWKSMIKEDKIKDFTSEQCYNQFRLCSKHFENRMFLNGERNRLKKNAVPMETITITLDSRSPERPKSILRDALLRPPKKVQVMCDHNYAQPVQCATSSSEVRKGQQIEKNMDQAASSCVTPCKNDKTADSVPNPVAITEIDPIYSPHPPTSERRIEDTPPETRSCKKKSPTPSRNSSSSSSLSRQKTKKPQASLNAMETDGDIQERNSIKDMDDTDHFFLSMSKAVKKLPKLEQSKIKLDLHNAISQAEIRSMHKVGVKNSSFNVVSDKLILPRLTSQKIPIPPLVSIPSQNFSIPPLVAIPTQRTANPIGENVTSYYNNIALLVKL